MTAIQMQRPVVHASTLVRSSVEHTFDVFVRTIAVWWPIRRLSAGRDKVQDVAVESRVGGRVYETWSDGTTRDWGEIVAWDPPSRFVMSWLSTAAPTEVELAFTALGPALTRVTVEHRGWEAFTAEQLAEDCASPGGYGTGSYDTGWNLVLDQFHRAIDGGVEITDDMMRERIGGTRPYTFLLLRRGPNYGTEGSDKIIWEHGRRNFALRSKGVLPIVCPVTDGSDVCGIGIFDATPDETAEIMSGDPGVQAGLFEVELHPVRSFPGDRLPQASQ